MPCGFKRQPDNTVRYEHDALCDSRHSATRYREPWRVPLSAAEVLRAEKNGIAVIKTDGEAAVMMAWERLSQAPPRERMAESLLGTRLEPLTKPPNLTAKTMGVPEDGLRVEGQGTMPRKVEVGKRPKPMMTPRKNRRGSRLVGSVSSMKVVEEGKLLIRVRGKADEVWDVPGLKMPVVAAKRPVCRCGGLKETFVGELGICGMCGHRCAC